MDGSIACWGLSDNGQATPPEGRFASVSSGWDHTCGVRMDGSIACWGDDHLSDAPLAGKFASVSAGQLHSCGVKVDGSVVCWGDGGDGRTMPPGEEFTSVSAGNYHACGVKADGTVACWGYNADGQANAAGGGVCFRQRRMGPHLRGETRWVGGMLGTADCIAPVVRQMTAGQGRYLGAGFAGLVTGFSRFGYC